MDESPESKPRRNQQNKITIMLADDHPLLRKALRDELENQPDFEVVAEVADGERAVKIATEIVPDVVIMDISMPKMNGIEATKRIKAKCPSIAVLVLTVHDETEHILSILQAGAAGYLMKTAFGEEVVQAVRGVVAGENVLSPEIFKRIIKSALRHITKPVSLDAGEKITTREQEILGLAARGLSNRDIARKLDLSEYTVKSYLVELFSKLKVSSRTEAVITALRAGFFTLGDLD